jgi:putative transposase
MAHKAPIVALEGKHRRQLEAMLKRGRWSPRELTRARILLLADDEKEISSTALAKRLGVSPHTVISIRTRFVEEGLEAALFDRPRPGQRKKMDKKDEAFVIATAVSRPPEGHGHWTLALLKKELEGKQGVVLSTEPIRKLLHRTGVRPWREKKVGNS